MRAAVLAAMIIMTTAMSSSAATPPVRKAGPAGSLVLVEESPAVPLVHVVIASRTGAASDPRGQEGLANLAGELARRGAAGRGRAALDEALDALGANLDVLVDSDSVRIVGQVLSRNLEPFLSLAADVVLRPDFDEAEFTRTRREILGQLDEQRNDDRSLCSRFFVRRLYGDHPYGHPADGTEKSLGRIRRQDAASHFKGTFVGPNLVFAAAGDVTADRFAALVAEKFRGLREGPAPKPPTLPAPVAHDGWRIQLVDKPDRQQTQIMLGHPALPASDQDYLPLSLALHAFGGRAMLSTLMDEVRTKRGLAYGAYMSVSPRRGPSALQAWVFTGAERTVTTLKLVLRLYRQLGKAGVPAERVRAFQTYLLGAYASDMDAPDRRLAARVSAEITGLPADWVETYPERLRAVTPEAVAAAVSRHVRPDNLAITLVGTADTLVKRLVEAKVAPGAIDVVPFDSY